MKAWLIVQVAEGVFWTKVTGLSPLWALVNTTLVSGSTTMP